MLFHDILSLILNFIKEKKAYGQDHEGNKRKNKNLLPL
jgi:hypothetical protein